MLFRRLYHDQLAQASYLVACQSSKQAIVVDPLRDIAPYLEAARQEGVRITMVTETHVHADFVSGAVALAAATGAALLLSGEGEGDAVYRRAAYPAARWLRDGESIAIGKVRLDVLHVPGHTPEQLALLVTDLATSTDPVGLLSGDFIFAGDVGRPDLLERAVGVTGTMEASARQLFASLQRARALPVFLQIWPGHGAGSACGKALGAVPQTTLGYELRSNWAFNVADEAEFVRQVLAGQPEPPAYFARMKRVNAAGGLPAPAATPLDEAAGRAALARGARVVDVRPAAEFAAGHLPRSINLPAGKSFLGWAGSVLNPDEDIVIVSALAARHAAVDAVRALSLIGLDRMRGIIATDDLAELRDEALATLPSVAAESLGAAAASDATILDVRNRSEWEAGHMPGARHIPLAELAVRLDELRGSGPLLVHCQGGSRSAVAASLLRASGFDDVYNVEGGYGAWLRYGHVPVTGS